MEKLILKDGTIYNIADGATSDRITIVLDSISDFGKVYSSLSDENLSLVTLQTAGGVDCAVIANKHLAGATAKNGDEVLMELELSTFDETHSRILALEKENAALQNQITETQIALVDLYETMGV